MNSISKRFAAVLVAAALSPFAAFAHDGHPPIDPALGAPAPAVAATRTVVIAAGTRYVNVNQGDVVRFEINGKTFVWQFDTLHTRSFDLAAIAPDVITAGHVRVYVDQNPLYRN